MRDEDCKEEAREAAERFRGAYVGYNGSQRRACNSTDLRREERMALDPVETFQRIRNSESLSERLALAIAHLEVDWDQLPYELRFRRSGDRDLAALSLPLREELDLDQSPTVDCVNPRLTQWIESTPGSGVTIRHLLALVVETDRALQKFNTTQKELAFLRRRHTLPKEFGGDLWIWDGPLWMREVYGRAQESRSRKGGKGLTPLWLYQPRLADWLTTLRFARSRIGVREIRFESLDNFTATELERRGEEIRVGLFSLSGSFSTQFRYTTRFAEQVHGFRASGVEPRREYLARLDRIL